MNTPLISENLTNPVMVSCPLLYRLLGLAAYRKGASAEAGFREDDEGQMFEQVVEEVAVLFRSYISRKINIQITTYRFARQPTPL